MDPHPSVDGQKPRVSFEGPSDSSSGIATPTTDNAVSQPGSVVSKSESTDSLPGPSTSGTGTGTVTRRRKFSTARIQPTRVKKVMQSDDEIGRMVQSVPVAIGRVMEHFAGQLLQKATQLAPRTATTKSKTLHPSYMRDAVDSTPYFGFLSGLVNQIPSAAASKPTGPMAASNSVSVAKQCRPKVVEHARGVVQAADSVCTDGGTFTSPKRKRGRPKKARPMVDDPVAKDYGEDDGSGDGVVERKLPAEQLQHRRTSNGISNSSNNNNNNNNNNNTSDNLVTSTTAENGTNTTLLIESVPVPAKPAFSSDLYADTLSYHSSTTTDHQ